MSKRTEASGQLTVSLTLGERPLLSARFQQQVRVEGDGRRALRAIRARAMAELALAWAEPPTRKRWRDGPK